ncbi:hypothetical protein L1785_12030 [Antribacter sp. KLBMP9083]|uniref:Cyclophilin-like domain-containing protein n=1 Tax=Antribacter soli TaxID=2910976 RepID=A0AA41U7L6_9MICO|nr:cyclophilin-like fold protein [Antribacter soli]MCF4121711.1 hypothetical protein [Antribacter soli]
MKPSRVSLAASVTLLAVLAGCAATEPAPTSGTASGSPAPPSSAAPTPSPTSSAAESPAEPSDPTQEVIGTVVRFTSDDNQVDVTIDQDTPAVRDFLSMLPLALAVEEFNGREKIAYLPRELDHQGTPGSDPEDGDLIYYTPWGNLGFYYNTAGIGYSDATLHLGTYDAALDQLDLLEGPVTVEVVP